MQQKDKEGASCHIMADGRPLADSLTVNSELIYSVEACGAVLPAHNVKRNTGTNS
jgi:hypothetical protein